MARFDPLSPSGLPGVSPVGSPGQMEHRHTRGQLSWKHMLWHERCQTVHVPLMGIVATCTPGVVAHCLPLELVAWWKATASRSGAIGGRSSQGCGSLWWSGTGTRARARARRGPEPKLRKCGQLESCPLEALGIRSNLWSSASQCAFCRNLLHRPHISPATRHSDVLDILQVRFGTGYTSSS